MAATCFDCGAELEAVDQIQFHCPNPACPGGDLKYLCGFCRQPSFGQPSAAAPTRPAGCTG